MKRAGLLSAFVLAAAAACAVRGEMSGSSEGAATPIDRMLIGEAAKYPADPRLRARLDELNGSMAARRRVAWAVVEKALTPVGIVGPIDAGFDAAPSAAIAPGPDGDPPLILPRFQTWYSREDVLPMFDHLFRSLSDDDKRARAPFSQEQLDGLFPWDATMAPTLRSFKKDSYDRRVRDIQNAAGEHSLGGNGRVLMSPAYVSHLFANYKQITSCDPPAPEAPPPTDTNFSPCLGAEFPIDAVSAKARWMPDSLPLPTYDTSAAAVTRYLDKGAFGEGDGTATPGEDEIYTMQLTATTKSKLVALHLVTKELRDWSWITLWWSNSPDTDFGADRPESIAALGGPWKNYKMCVVTAFGENDKQPGAAFRDTAPTLADALDAAAAAGPSTWCSNPYLELGDHNAKTNCIGCHQYGGTGASTESVLSGDGDPRVKVRQNFPVDYAFTTSTGLDLASSMKDTMTNLTPP